ncbi:MAG TPA: ABC transporter permease [Steroidobacteraceae bacterium]|nr:ABC transporter permease [Steroidobacteraceae bacterium]
MTDPVTRAMPRPGRFVAECDAVAGLLRLRGDCRALDVAVLERGLAEWTRAGARTLDLADAGRLDIGPAWLLQRALAEASTRGARPTIVGPVPAHFAYLAELLAGDAEHDPLDGSEASRPWLVRFGHALHERFHTWYEALSYGGALLATARDAWRSLRRLRLASVVRHAYETGYQAVPVVAVIAFLISVISAYIGAQQLRPYGAEIFTVDLVALGVLRELGVLLTAIMVAGRTGSAFAAEIGVMKLNDEIDALESMGINPYEVLVLPRVLALVIALPLLTIVADFMGLLGGGLLARYLIDLPWPQFFQRLDEAIAPTTFWAGLVKAPVFGILIALTGTLRGLQVRESSRELGRLTTVAVVQSIFLVIFADALFAIFFLEIDF